MKDERFAHEEEVRAVFRMTKRNEQEIEEWRSQPFSVLGFPTRLPLKNEAPRNVYIPIDSEFDHSVMLDPRAPIWRIKSMTQMLRKYGLDPSVSPAFGYILEEDRFHLPDN